MTETSSPARAGVLRRMMRPLLWSAGVLAVLAGLGFGVAPPIARHYAVQMIGEVLGRQVTIERIDFNPFTLTVDVLGLKLMEADGQREAFAFERLRVNAELESLVRGGPVVHELALRAPRLNLVLDAAGRSSNWQDVIDRLAARPQAADGDQALPFSLGNIRVSGGHVQVEDVQRGRRHELAELEIGVPFVSNLPVKVDVFVEPTLSAKLNGEAVDVGVRTRPFRSPLETQLRLKLDDFELAPWVAYLPFEPGFRLPSGRLSTELELSFVQPDSSGAVPQLSLRGRLQLDELAVQDAQGAPVARVAALELELADVQPLARRWHFTRLRLQQPELELLRYGDGRFNLATLLPPTRGASAAAPASVPASSAPADVLLAEARIRDGRLGFEDRSLTQPFATRIEALNLDLRDLSSTGDMPAEIRFDYQADGGARFSHDNRLSLAPFALEGSVTLEGVEPARFAPYLAAALPAGEVRGGRLDGTVRYRLGSAASDIEVVAETLALREFVLALKGHKDAALSVPVLDVREAAIDVEARTVKVAAIGIEGAALSARRLKDGRIDLMQLLTPPAAQAKSKGVPGKRAPGKGERLAAARTTTPATAPEWSVNVDKLALAGAALRVEDRTLARPVTLALDAIDLQLEQLSTARGATAKMSLDARVQPRGRLGASGTLALTPLQADLQLDLQRVDLLPLQAYVLEQTRIGVARGSLGTRGRLNLGTAKNGELRARYRGRAGVANFAAVDRIHAGDLLRWRVLDVTGLDLHLQPFALDVDRIGVEDFHTRLLLDEQGRLNLRDLAGEARADASPPAEQATAAPAAAEPEPAAPLPPIRIGRIELKGGDIAFSDRFIRPNYDVRLTGMGGELVGLSSAPDTIARLDLSGKVDDAAPVRVSGELNPFRQDSHLNILGTVKDFELTGLSGYSGKYVGYGIARGKLSAELNYRIEARQLTASNQIFLDQLSFGDKIDSPDAMNLPVQLAVALLKNGRGEIDLHLPVSGTLDDPEFSVFGLVVKMFVNLIGKAITAPFALLGAALGGGEELSQLAFESGQARIAVAHREKLATLAQALRDRPGLALDIIGRADPASDTEGLKRERVQQQVRALKLKGLLEKRSEAASVEDIVVGAEEYPALLKQVYRAADFKKPRNLIGLARDLPVAEMEALLVANTIVTEPDLRALAQQRAQAVRHWMSTEGQVAGERVFVLEPRVEAITDAGQVRFSLR